MSGVGYGVAYIRQRRAAALDKQAVIQSAPLVQQGTSATYRNWAALTESAPLACAVYEDDTQPTESVVAGQVRAVLQWRIVFAYPLPAGVTLVSTNRIRVYDPAGVYEVLDTNQGKSHPVNIEAYCVKVG